MRSKHLSTVIPVSLVAIVLTRVVRGGDVHTCLCTQLTDSEGDLRRGTEALEEISLDAVGGEDGCHGLCEHTSVVAAVVTYDDSEILTAWEGLEDVVGEALCGHAYDVLVHTVGTGSHDTTESTCTKLEVLIEGVDESGLVLCVEHCLYFFTCLLIKGGREPFFCPCLALSDQLCIVCHNQ